MGAPHDFDAEGRDDVGEGQLQCGAIQVGNVNRGAAQRVHQRQAGCMDQVVAIALHGGHARKSPLSVCVQTRQDWTMASEYADRVRGQGRSAQSCSSWLKQLL